MHVHAALDKAVAEGLITVNPATGCKLPPKKGREMQVLTKEELYRLFLQAKEDGYYELFLLDVSTGMRRGELLALQWEDVDFERSEIRICRQVNRVDGKLVVSEPKTKGSVRTVCLPKPIMNMLKIYEQTAVGKWLFPSPNEPDTPRDPASVRKALSRILKHAGCKHVRFHDLRHTFATLSLENGVDIKTVAEILGHSTVETALNTYTHITEEMKRSAAQKIDLQIARVEPKRGGGEDTAPGSKTQQIAPYEPYRGKIRKRGTGCISHLTENCWQGKYTPRTKDGKREIHAVYAETEEECEQKLAAMIAEIKAESQIS
jgi:integrase